ncbi:MAG TPA: hypothetical protein VFP27_18635 [Mycobacterium sp.]|nr:hypothetical protein [Mycobacterium sp.]
MAVRVLPAIAHDGVVDVVALRGMILAGVAVARCDCGGLAYAVELRPGCGPRQPWFGVACRACGHEAAFHGRPAAEVDGVRV